MLHRNPVRRGGIAYFKISVRRATVGVLLFPEPMKPHINSEPDQPHRYEATGQAFSEANTDLESPNYQQTHSMSAVTVTL